MTRVLSLLFVLALSLSGAGQTTAQRQTGIEESDHFPSMCVESRVGGDYLATEDFEQYRELVGEPMHAIGNVVRFHAPGLDVDIVVTAFGSPDLVTQQAPQNGEWLAVCFVVTPLSSRVQTLDLNNEILSLGSLENRYFDLPTRLCRVFTASNTEPSLGCFSDGMSDEIEPGPSVTYAAIFDVSPDGGAYFLRLTGESENAKETIDNVALGDPSIVASGPQPELFSDIPYPPHVRITAFGEQGLITVFPDKWLITFETVEVRYVLGDGSIVPQRGQFLVIWFTQIAQGTSPLPMGDMTLQAHAPSTGESNTYSVSQEGTTALAVTEFTWNPGAMSSGTPYRTGVVFDIQPQDTQFRLTYPLPPDHPAQDQIDVRFEA